MVVVPGRSIRPDPVDGIGTVGVTVSSSQPVAVVFVSLASVHQFAHEAVLLLAVDGGEVSLGGKS